MSVKAAAPLVPRLPGGLSHHRPMPRRGLQREEAAAYVCVGTTTFDKMVADGRMPRPRRIGERKVWDIRDLDLAFDALPYDTAPESQGGTSWDDR